MNMYLIDDIDGTDIKQEPNRAGFGRGLVTAGEHDENVVALCADLTESTQISKFAEAFPDRYVEIGIGEQNLVTVASGMAALGKMPFASSYAAFAPGRCWEQIRTTICLNQRAVCIVGSHAGMSVGPDGATHQMLEDLALMRALPNMTVVVPADSMEAEKAALALARLGSPSYLRLAREKTAIFTTKETPFELGKAYVLREGSDIALMATGTSTYQALLAANILAGDGIHAEVVHVPTIKPLDADTILASALKCGRVITVEEGQIAAGFGGAITELLSENLPMPVKRIGMQDQFGESGPQPELLKKYGLTGDAIAMQAHDWISKMPQYHR
ncbi:MAG TPA: transketolase C-terminal domain-containing protein [Magnetospirillaceae bacterium]|nr:transketolase C-terminal domain-containing protein [Magnetospirillaceae bacterium]